MKKLLIYLLLAAMILSFVACKKEETAPTEDGKTYTFTSGTTRIALGADISTILAALGEWRAYDESPSCAFEGMDKIYEYSGFEIYTQPNGEKDIVYMIRLFDDTIATEEGIRVGSAKDAVIATYGTATQASDSNLRYNAKGMYLQFSLENGVVTSIQYGKI